MEKGEQYLRELRDNIAEQGIELTTEQLMEMLRLTLAKDKQGLIEYVKKIKPESDSESS